MIIYKKIENWWNTTQQTKLHVYTNWRQLTIQISENTGSFGMSFLLTHDTFLKDYWHVLKKSPFTNELMAYIIGERE